MKYCIIYNRLRDNKEVRTRLASLTVTKRRLENNFDERHNPRLVSKSNLKEHWFD